MLAPRVIVIRTTGQAIIENPSALLGDVYYPLTNLSTYCIIKWNFKRKNFNYRENVDSCQKN